MFSPILYSSYFENVAAQHPDILHENVTGKIAFATDDFNDFFNGEFKVSLKPQGICMRLIEPMIDPQTDESANFMASVQCGFSIIKKAVFETMSIRAAQEETYRIMQQIIARLMHDSRKGATLFDGSLNQLQYANFHMEKVFFEGDGQWFGYILTFVFKSAFIDDLDETIEETQWKDLI